MSGFAGGFAKGAMGGLRDGKGQEQPWYPDAGKRAEGQAKGRKKKRRRKADL